MAEIPNPSPIKATEQERPGRGGRGRGRGRHRGRFVSRTYSERKFEGMEPTLKGKVFDFNQEPQAKQYADNVEAIMR